MDELRRYTTCAHHRRKRLSCKQQMTRKESLTDGRVASRATKLLTRAGLAVGLVRLGWEAVPLALPPDCAYADARRSQ